MSKRLPVPRSAAFGYLVAAGVTVMAMLLSVGNAQGEVRRVLVVMQSDGSQPEILVKEPQPGVRRCGSPSWSPDGNWIAFDAETESGYKVLLVGMAESNRGEIRSLGDGAMPTWAPDGKQLAFAINPGNKNNILAGIWLTKAEGGELRWLAEGGSPAWSPRGDLIAVTSFGSQRTVTLAAVHGPARRALMGEQQRISRSRLTWAPDGRRVMFVPAVPEKDELFWIIDTQAASPQPHRFGRAPAAGRFPENWGMPSWSPDGQQILFQMFPNAANSSELYRLPLDDPEEPQRVHPAGFISSGEASWSPDGKRVVFAARWEDGL